MTQPPWLAIGPAPLIGGPKPNPPGNTNSGAVTAIAILPGDGSKPAAMLLGTEGGGVWKSTNFRGQAPTWRPVLEGLSSPAHVAGALDVNAIAVDPGNSTTVYVATGAGILKSTDDGENWSLMAENLPADKAAIRRLLVHPTNSKILFATVNISSKAGKDLEGGVFRSTDGGMTWTPRIAGIDPRLSGDGIEFTIDGSQRAFYAGLTSTGDPGKNGIWRSTDDGETWQQEQILVEDLGSRQRGSNKDIERISLAVDHLTPGTPHGIVAAITKAGTGGFLLNIFKRGADGTWGAASGGLQPQIFTLKGKKQAIGISPNGAIYYGAGPRNFAKKEFSLFQSTDGGRSWATLDNDPHKLRPHVDQLCFAFDDTGAVYVGNDGGIWRFTPRPNNQAGPGSWQSLNTPTLSTILTYSVSFHPVPSILMIGTQDNGAALRASSGWYYCTGGDVTRIRVDPDPTRGGQYIYIAYPPEMRDDKKTFSFFARSQDHGAKWSDVVINDQAIQWHTVLEIDPANTSRLLLGLTRVHQSLDHGASWSAISPQLKGDGVFIKDLAFASDPKTLYVAYQTTIFRTTNNGGNGSDSNWKTVGNSFDNLNAIAVDRLHHVKQPDRVYAATARGEVWRLAPDGSSKEKITGNLPPMQINALALVHEPGQPDPYLFIGTDAGVFVSLKQGGPHQGAATCWQRFGSGLPDVKVNELQVHETARLLAAATYGRGVFLASIANLRPPSVRIIVPLGDCNVGPAEGQTVVLTAKADGLTPPLTYQWSVVGAAKFELNTFSETFAVTLPQQPGGPHPVKVEVAVTVDDAEGCRLSAATTITPLRFDDWAQRIAFCDLLQRIAELKELDRPLRGPAPDFSITTISVAELSAIHEMAQVLLDESRRLMQLLGAGTVRQAERARAIARVIGRAMGTRRGGQQ